MYNHDRATVGTAARFSHAYPSVCNIVECLSASTPRCVDLPRAWNRISDRFYNSETPSRIPLLCKPSSSLRYKCWSRCFASDRDCRHCQCYVVQRFDKSADWTSDKVYTLSDQTKKILHGLDREVQVIAFFSLNPTSNQLVRDHQRAETFTRNVCTRD